MTDYLPKGVTLEDWRYARTLAEDDVCIMFQDYTNDGYMESDLVDTDSLLSMQMKGEADQERTSGQPDADISQVEHLRGMTGY